ncbi:hypothetical protein SD81_028425 [Tolypothrix campylonemoides VB511288]|nr:hypothetical protein SD81_028425 [Tolypothrix campylonemoides VB511288]
MTNQPCSICAGVACRDGTRKGKQQWYCPRCNYCFVEGTLPRPSTLLRRKNPGTRNDGKNTRKRFRACPG